MQNGCREVKEVEEVGEVTRTKMAEEEKDKGCKPQATE